MAVKKCNICKSLPQSKLMPFTFKGKFYGVFTANGCEHCGYLFSKKTYEEALNRVAELKEDE